MIRPSVTLTMVRLPLLVTFVLLAAYVGPASEHAPALTAASCVDLPRFRANWSAIIRDPTPMPAFAAFVQGSTGSSARAFTCDTAPCTAGPANETPPAGAH